MKQHSKDNFDEAIHELEEVTEFDAEVGTICIRRLRVPGGYLYITTAKNHSARIALDTEFVPEGMER